jgi:nondiscriminating glutamyl-tRNA synthetase
VTPSPAVFDWDKLHWLNRQAMKHSPLPELRALAWPYFTKLKLLPESESESIVNWFDRVLTLFLPAVDQLQQLPERAAVIWRIADTTPEDAAILNSEAGAKVAEAFKAKVCAQTGAMTPERFKELMNEVKVETGVKGKDLFHPVRIILTGAHSGPEFDKLIPLFEDGSHLDLPAPVLSVRERVDLWDSKL